MILLTESDARPARDDWPRKGGRVIVEHDGQTIECYSPSNLPNYLGAGFSAPAWSARCQAKGAGLRPDLAIMAAPLDVSADRDELDRLVAEMEMAGAWLPPTGARRCTPPSGGYCEALDDMRTQERIQRERGDEWHAKWSAHDRLMSAMCDALADATRRLQAIFGQDLTWDELLHAAVAELENRAEEA